MRIEIKSGQLATGTQHPEKFSGQVLSAGVAIGAFVLHYDSAELERMREEGVDHHVEKVAASVDIVSTSGDTVTVKATGEIRDSSGNSGGGTVTYSVIADIG